MTPIPQPPILDLSSRSPQSTSTARGRPGLRGPTNRADLGGGKREPVVAGTRTYLPARPRPPRARRRPAQTSTRAIAAAAAAPGPPKTNPPPPRGGRRRNLWDSLCRAHAITPRGHRIGDRDKGEEEVLPRGRAAGRGDAAAVDGDRVGEGRGGLCEGGEGEVMWGRARSRSLSSLSLSLSLALASLALVCELSYFFSLLRVYFSI